MRCDDHWHCDQREAAHVCTKPDRTKPCPTCGERSDRKLEGGERLLIARALREQAKLGRQAATMVLERLNKPTDRPTPSALALKLQTQVDNLNAEAQVCDRLASEIEQHTVIIKLGAVE